MLGTRLKERYHLQDELGRGGMAVVFRARDELLRRDVAVKILHPHLADRRSARLRLHREALAAAKLSHENILKVFDFSSEDEAGPAFLVTEYVRGHTLRALLEYKDLPCEVAAMVGMVLAEALALAHAEGIIHRDIKPENVMFRAEDGVVKLMDFGIAKLFEEQELTATQGLLGSPAHMAPEVIEGKPVDTRADLFSLGTVIYLLATGEYPFWGSNPHALLRQISQGKFKAPESQNPAVGRRLGGIIKRLMALDPKNRYPTAQSAAADLKSFLAEVGIDDPHRTLKALLRDIPGESAKLKDSVVAALLVRAQEALKAGKKGEVLAHLNRVLAYEPDKAEAAALLASLDKRPWWFYAAAAGGGLFLLGGGALGVSFWLQPPPVKPPRPVAPDSLRASPSSNIFLPELLAGPGLSDPPPGREPGPSSEAVPPLEPASVPSPPPSSTTASGATSAPVLPSPQTKPSGPERPPETKPKVTRFREVLLRTDFWKDITLDGKGSGRFTGDKALTLAAGSHKLSLQNPGCKTLHYDIEVRDTGGSEPLLFVNGVAARTIEARCDWLDAILVVQTDPPEVKVRVYGAGDKFIGSLRGGKVYIPMPDSQATMSLSFISGDNQVVSRTLELRAGAKHEVGPLNFRGEE
jgi:serine/threonine-protein kinase